MVPSLRDGDLVLALPWLAARPGAVVLARFRDMPEVLVVKRAVRPEGDGWWLSSDNSFAGGDSDSHGVADVAGRVVLIVRDRRWRRVPGAPV